jgi:hypothetical protein
MATQSPDAAISSVIETLLFYGPPILGAICEIDHRVNRAFETRKDDLVSTTGDVKWLWAEYGFEHFRWLSKTLALARYIGIRETVRELFHDEGCSRLANWKGGERRSGPDTLSNPFAIVNRVKIRRFTDDPQVMPLILRRPASLLCRKGAW